MTSRRLAAVMIARDEERCIERALRSVRDHVDAMFVLDTGSTDRTKEIARSAGAVVAELEWPNDFSIARNVALDLADAQWNLVIDADEWAVGGLAGIHASLHDQDPYTGLVSIQSSYRADGLPVTSVGHVTRLVPAGAKFGGAVHEQVDATFPIRLTPIVFAHDGYDAEHTARKSGRNERMLRSALKRRPHDAYLLYQLGADLQAQQRYEDAADVLVRAFATAPVDVPWRRSLSVRAVSVSGKVGRFSDALTVLDSVGDLYSDSPDLRFAQGNLFLDMALSNPSTAGELLPLVEASWLACLEIGDRPDLEGSVIGRGSHLAAHNLASFYESLGNSREAAAFRNRAAEATAIELGSTNGRARR